MATRGGLLIIAHRGASAVAPESTRPAIRAAIEAGADMIELDVQMTRDRRLIVFHDERLERTTNGSGRLSARRYADLAQLDAGSWFHPRFAGERILLVSQAIRCIPPPRRMNLELKRTATRSTLLRHLIRLIRQMAVMKRLLISSFDSHLLKALPPSGLSRALICDHDPDRSLATAVRLGCESWHPSHRVVRPRHIHQAHAAGLRVYVWTVDEPRRARALAAWGIDGLFTNHPAAMAHGNV